MKPTLVLIGRPNVGKSTLFNRLTKTRDAIVADRPGLTRDRHYGHGCIGTKPFLVVDTGGFEPRAADGILHEMARQTEQALFEADIVFFIVDGRQGLTSDDEEIARKLRRVSCPVYLVVNKAEGMNRDIAEAAFYELGIGQPYAISSAHGDGVAALIELALASYPESHEAITTEPEQAVKIAIVGRPNVGKSTLINSLIGEERVIAFDQPGTTRDAIHIDFQRGDRRYILVDTAGVRRKGRVFEAIEKFSVIKTLQAIEQAHVVVLVLDARQDIAEQDAHLAGFIAESGRALVVAVNKWDKLDAYTRDRIRADVERRLRFLAFARFHYVSALENTGLTAVLKSVDVAFQAAMVKMPTPKLTRLLIAAVARHPPPRHGISRPKLRYAHQGGQNPPIVVIHGQALDHVGDSYRRYLERVFHTAFKLEGTPLRIEFKMSYNPYVDTDNPPRPRRSGRGQSRKQRAGLGKSNVRKINLP